MKQMQRKFHVTNTCLRKLIEETNAKKLPRRKYLSAETNRRNKWKETSTFETVVS